MLADRICVMRVKEHIQGDLHLDDTQMGFVFSAFMLGYALFEVPGGWLGDRWGPRRVLTAIVLGWSLFTALTGCIYPFESFLFNGFLLMLLVRFLFGAGEAGAYPNLARVTAVWFPFRERALATGVIWLSARSSAASARHVTTYRRRLKAVLRCRSRAGWV